jgi:predicted lipoprotein with Yx(FWY)xxD motif
VQEWSPVLVSGQPVLYVGVHSEMVGTIERKDGTTQVTYNGWPLYYHVKDQGLGDLTGQGSDEAWYVVTPEGIPIKTAASTAEASTAELTTVQVLQRPDLGAFLADGEGQPFYLFLSDTPSLSTCYGACAQEWSPALVSGQPVLYVGVHSEMVGAIERKDGATQLTYNGWPLYYHVKDQGLGDLTGQGSDEAWYVVTPEGIPIKTAPQRLGRQPPNSPQSRFFKGPIWARSWRMAKGNHSTCS